MAELSSWRLVGAIVGVVAVLAVAVKAWIDRGKGKSTREIAAEVIIAISGVMLAVIALVVDVDDDDEPSGLQILEPAGGTQRVPWCNLVRVGGRLPSGKALTVANSERDDIRWYFEGAVNRVADRDEWNAEVLLGDVDEDTRGVDFTIYAVVMDEDLANYLATTTAEENATYWSSPAGELPPGAEVADHVNVQRNDEPNTEC